MGSILFTGGGTGGHLTIIRAVIEHFKEDNKLIYIGSTKGQDREWFEDEKKFDSKYFLKTSGVMDKEGLIGKFDSLLDILKQVKEAREILKKEDVKVVFSVGGFSAAPASIAALTLNIPLVIHEQNAHIGTLNRVLKPFANAFISSYEDNPIGRVYPVKQIFFDKARVRSKIDTILISGGSQGSVALNKFALKIAPMLRERGVKIYHQAGVKNLDEVKAQYKKLNINAEVFGFTKKMPEIMEKADFAIARAGASTLWEMVANGLPALFVPYPYAANDHQYHNAKFLDKQGLAWLVRENQLNENIIKEILDKDLSEISRKLQTLITPDGSLKIANYLKKFV